MNVAKAHFCLVVLLRFETNLPAKPFKWIRLKWSSTITIWMVLRFFCGFLRPVQTLATLLGPTCCERLQTMLCVGACCCDLLEVVGWSLKLVKLQSQQVPTFLLFRGHQSVVQQCCVRLHSTSNNVAPAHAHYMPRIHTNTCEQEINMASEMDNVPESYVFSSKDPTCCDLLRAFAHIC